MAKPITMNLPIWAVLLAGLTAALLSGNGEPQSAHNAETIKADRVAVYFQREDDPTTAHAGPADREPIDEDLVYHRIESAQWRTDALPQAERASAAADNDDEAR